MRVIRKRMCCPKSSLLESLDRSIFTLGLVRSSKRYCGMGRNKMHRLHSFKWFHASWRNQNKIVPFGNDGFLFLVKDKTSPERELDMASCDWPAERNWGLRRPKRRFSCLERKVRRHSLQPADVRQRRLHKVGRCWKKRNPRYELVRKRPKNLAEIGTEPWFSGIESWKSIFQVII